jgi:hypothetical protein
MSASAWIKFHKANFYGMTGTIDYDDAAADTFKCALLLSTYTPDLTDDTWADLSGHEHANANGYTAGGVGLTSVVFINTAGVDKWDAADISWAAVGGAITARYAVIYHVASGKLIRYCELEDGADKTAAVGNDFVIQLAAGGIFDIT